ncbi:sucrase ferredoxin [Roseobacter sp. CCS2]|uniref:sucrase ferredoxin n=1 Tax=Roseobacter sp. CCS2 TaxID=391593 RepID=UPI0000F403A1|nr:sucrase ferredoxin [Roseobacter sp. CCS2]EBA13660.1 hypothetical protein RCCS2_07224 [Roseobacter sp. CCS2]
MTKQPTKHAFCTDYARAEGEPLAGWGAHQSRNILIQWPKRHWKHSLRIAAGMSDDLVAAIDESVELGWRVNLIDRKPYLGETLRVYQFPDAVAFDISPDDLPRLIRDITSGNTNAQAPHPLTKPVITCCTHGKHDRCCAKFGFASYKALATAAEGRVSVWEVTHLGGCRLSASVLVFPQLHKYGRVGVSDAAGLIDAAINGAPYLPKYRGASHLSPPAQVADLTVLKSLAEQGRVGPVSLTEVSTGENHVRFHFTSPKLTGEVISTANQIATYGSCEDLENEPGPNSKTIWTAKIVPSGP